MGKINKIINDSFWLLRSQKLGDLSFFLKNWTTADAFMKQFALTVAKVHLNCRFLGVWVRRMIEKFL
jgi:hypothetical protein